MLEIGYAHMESRYVEALRALGIPRLVGIDRAPGRPELGDLLHRVVADVRSHVFLEATFELILCISTIEHIGRDNAVYGLAPEPPTAHPDWDAIRNFRFWLAPRGRALLSVPYGRREDHGWFVQYDSESLGELIQASQLRVEHASFFEQRGGWVPCRPEDLRARGYGTLGAPNAAGVALVELVRE